MSSANSQRHRKNKVQRPFHGKRSAKGIKDLGEKPCIYRRFGDDPCLRPVHEPVEEAPASSAPLFQIDSNFDSEPLGRTDLCVFSHLYARYQHQEPASCDFCLKTAASSDILYL